MENPCDILTDKLSDGIGSLLANTTGMDGLFNGVKNKVDNIGGKSLSDLNDASNGINGNISTLGNNMTGAVNDALDVGCGVLDECADGILDKLGKFAKSRIPFLDSLNLLKGTLGFDISDYLGSADEYASAIIRLGINAVVGKLDNYINCLDANPDGPPPEVLQESIDTINNTLDSLGLDANGELDESKMYDGVSLEAKIVMNNVEDTYSQAKTDIQDAAKDVVEITSAKPLPSKYW